MPASLSDGSMSDASVAYAPCGLRLQDVLGVLVVWFEELFNDQRMLFQVSIPISSTYRIQLRG